MTDHQESYQVSADQDREIEVTASETHVFLRVTNWQTGELLEDYALKRHEAQALLRGLQAVA